MSALTFEALKYKSAQKRAMTYKYMNVNNDFAKLKKYTFTIATVATTLKTMVDGKHEVTRDVAVGDFVIRGPSGDIYSTTADRFFMSYNMTGTADVIPAKKDIALVPKKLFGEKEILTFNDAYGKEVKVYPGDGIIMNKNPQSGAPEYWRIDKKVLKQTYVFDA
jgi:hypothetical protein